MRTSSGLLGSHPSCPRGMGNEGGVPDLVHPGRQSRAAGPHRLDERALAVGGAETWRGGTERWSGGAAKGDLALGDLPSLPIRRCGLEFPSRTDDRDAQSPEDADRANEPQGDTVARQGWARLRE